MEKARFIGRENELSMLERRYSSDSFEFCPVYGRRRVGKTALIGRFLEGKRHIYFSAVRSGMANNLRVLSGKILGLDGLAVNGSASFGTLEDALDAVADMAADERLVLAVDEFPYLAESDRGAVDVFQRYIDGRFAGTKLFLILCGSSMSFMEEQLFDDRSPLYGRLTCQLRVGSMDYLESSMFMDGRTDAERAEIYSMVGGVPMYLNLFDNGRAVEDVVTDAFLRYDAPLRGETERLLSQEIPGYAQYVDVVEAVASGRGRVKEIADRTGLETSVVSMCLKRLSSLGYVDRETPFGSDGGRSTRYVLCDNLFRFYYRFLFPGDGSSVYDSEERLKADCGRIMARLPEHTGRVFEAMCAQYIARTSEYRRLGRWWGPDAKSRTVEEIGIVGSRRTDAGDVGLFAECRYGDERVGADVLDGLIRRSGLVGGFASREYMLFSKGGFTPELERRAAESGARLVTLEDMYALSARRRLPESNVVR